MPETNLAPGQQCGEYTLIQPLGEGAVGTVYEAADRNGIHVALKFVGPLSNSWFKKEYEREVHGLLQFQNPQTISILNHFTWNNFGVIALEKMDMDLLDFIENNDTADEEEAKIIFKQICLGLAELHRNDTAHLDIKPENVFMNDIFSVKLADFGSSFKWSAEVPQKFGLTGTSFYCAPEVKNKPSYDAAEADIWSLGILLHVLCSGFWPYAARTDVELTAFIKAGKIELLFNKLPSNPDLISLLRNMLQFFPSNRLIIEEILESPWLEGVDIPNTKNTNYTLVEVEHKDERKDERENIPILPININSPHNSPELPLKKKRRPAKPNTTLPHHFLSSASNPDLSELPNRIVTPRFQAEVSSPDDVPSFMSPRGRRSENNSAKQRNSGNFTKTIIRRFKKLIG